MAIATVDDINNLSEFTKDAVKQIVDRIKKLEIKVEDVTGQTRVHQVAISNLVAPAVSKGSPLNHKAAEKHLPEAWTGEKGARPFTQFKYDLENWAAALHPDDDGVKLMSWAAVQKGQVDIDEGELESDHIKEFNRALARTLVTCTRGSARTTVQQAGAGNGLDAWRLLVAWNQPRSATDKASSMLALIKPDRCKALAELRRGIEQWEVHVR